MSYQVEHLGKNMVKLTIEASAGEFEKALEKAYQKNKSKLNVQGFRKGKAPRHVIEKMYGAGIFYEDAANEIIPDAYEEAARDSKLDIVSRPEIDVTQVEKGSSFIFTAEFAVKPEVTLSQYKGIEISKPEVSLSDEEVLEEINKIREQNSRTITVDDRAVMDGDEIVIDFEGFVDGVPFEGGKSENYKLKIGSHSFIDTFEEQLIGKQIGEETEVHVNFPEQYHAAELAGKPALFKVKVNEITVKELPELDDDFAQDVSEFDNLAEYKESIRKVLLEKKEKEAKTAKEDALVDKLIEGAAMEIPDAMIETQKRNMADDFVNRLKMQGLSLEQYFQFTGLTANTFMEQLIPQALKRIQSRLVLEAVVKQENIVPTEDEVEHELNEMAAAYKMDIAKVKEILGEAEMENVKMDIAIQKAIDFIAESAVEI